MAKINRADGSEEDNQRTYKLDDSSDDDNMDVLYDPDSEDFRRK